MIDNNETKFWLLNAGSGELLYLWVLILWPSLLFVRNPSKIMIPTRIELFEKYKRILFVVAYKMTKSLADAEDIVQDVFISFSKQTLNDIQNLENYLVKSVMNRSLSLLEKQKQITYPGINLPEPLFYERSHYIHEQDISYALLLLLQTLNPTERAIFILRETLAFDYTEIASILSIREADCRQQLHRAKEKNSRW